jgi:phosphinothricin acetyltransferase
MAPAIRPATRADMAAVAAIYAQEVLHGTATAEEVPPGEDEIARRFAEFTGGGHPWLVAELDGQVVGYAYARPYHARAAYRWTVEDAVYIAADARGRGIGTALLGALIPACRAAGRKQMIASITVQGGEASIALHRRFGFRDVGRMEAIICKFGRWLDCTYLQLAL